MRHGKTYDVETIRQKAAKAADDSGLSRVEIAAELGVTASAVSRALSENERPGHFLKLQREIIALLTDYRIEESPEYRAIRKGKA